MTHTVSVIVPVYNAESTLERCVTGILAQEYTDFELILINDGSTDRSGTICDGFAEADRRVRAIHQPNRGASAARNAGLEAARGEYVMFCDSDDLVSPMWIARLMAYAVSETLPMGSYCHKVAELGTETLLSVPCGQICPRDDYYSFNRAGIAGYLCNALYDGAVVRENGLKFRERREQGDYNEDLLFTLQYVRHVNRIVYTGYADYCYDTREGSLSRSGSRFYFPKYREKFQLWHDFLTDVRGSQQDFAALAESSLYHCLTALHRAFLEKDRRRFREIVRSDVVARCLALSPCPKENPRVIALLKRRASARLWLLFTFSSLKGRKTI